MLQTNCISKSYGINLILSEISLAIDPADRVGLVGVNGCGKSTLMEIITGRLEPDSGSIAIEKGIRLGYLPQDMLAESGKSIHQLMESKIPGLTEARSNLESLAARLPEEDDTILQAFGSAQTLYENLGGYGTKHRAEEILAGLGLKNLSLETPLEQLSGGQLTRVHLAGILLAEPDILLLDEPTNHLDIDSLEWLEGFLSSYRGAVMIVSHDRVFLDNCVKRILEIDEVSRELREYVGNYSAYAARKALELHKRYEAWRDQQAEIRRLKADINRTAEQARQTERGTKDSKMRRYAKKVAKKAKSKEKRLQQYRDSEERVERPEQKWRLRLNFGKSPHSSQIVLRTKNLGHTYGTKWLFTDLNLAVKHADRIALVGPNGSGKTTLLKIIMGNLKPSAGSLTIGPSVRLGYMPQQQETLDPNANPVEVIQTLCPMGQSETHHFLHYFLFEEDEVYLPSSKLSFGQRARLLLARLVASGANCLILDEPINHLDIPSREQFERALEIFSGTVIVAAHDRAFINRTSDILWSLKEGVLRKEYLKNILD